MNFLNLKKLFTDNLSNFLNINSIYRKIILICCDYASINASWFITKFLIYDIGIIINSKYNLYHFFFIQITALPIYFISNQYKPLTRFLNSSFFYSIISRNFIIICISIFCLDLIKLKIPQLTFWLIFLFVNIFLQIGYRLIIKDLVNVLLKNTDKKDGKRVAIYKADFLGFQLSNILHRDFNYKVICFLDDSPVLEGNTINSIPIKVLNNFKNKKEKIESLILTSEFKSTTRNKILLKELQSQGIEITKWSPLQYLKNQNYKDNNYFYPKISQQEILGRKKVKPSEKLIKASINKNISVLITGAGGSIGSELSRQVINMKPKHLILIDFCEYNLFKIYEELKDYNIDETNLVPKLINTENRTNLTKTFKEYDVNLIFHAAAYKHVGLVELNPVEGLKNNLLSTKSICEAAINSNVEKLILISSDKAVKPTNIMGGTKLLSEFILKKYSEKKEISTKFVVVRFGNVLDSSGSVIPIFREQIKNGGPITITDVAMERFFMTISEAVHLVLQASVLANGGETFLLNMGKSVKILDIAKRMVSSAGLKIKDHNERNGDIEIKIIGIKKGEKLKEELLINGSIKNTKHPLINKAEEDINLPSKLLDKIDKIIDLSTKNDQDKALELFNALIKNYI